MEEAIEIERYVETATAQGPVLEELVALALFYPMGYPPFGLHGVQVDKGLCRVFRDGIGEYSFAPLTDDDDAEPIYEILGRPYDEPGSPGREGALRAFVVAVRGRLVDRQKTMPREHCPTDEDFPAGEARRA